MIIIECIEKYVGFISNFMVKLFNKKDDKPIVKVESDKLKDLLDLLEVQDLYNRFNTFITILSENLHVTTINIAVGLKISIGKIKKIDISTNRILVENTLGDGITVYQELININDLDINDLKIIVKYINKCNIWNEPGAAECTIYLSPLGNTSNNSLLYSANQFE